VTLGTGANINIAKFYAVSDTWYRGKFILATFYAVGDTWYISRHQYSEVFLNMLHLVQRQTSI